jgi:peptidoglycan/xylan/chitin deacetylase (PgdA/CDA1 family)
MPQLRAYGWKASVVALALAANLAAQVPAGRVGAAPPRQQPGVSASVDQLKAQIFHVSAGRRLKPRTWPNGAKAAVVLSFDVENAVDSLVSGDLGSEPLSRGEYGAVDGLPRILRLLDKQSVPASFYMSGLAAALHPQMIPEILAAKQKHEIGVHGWMDEDLMVLNDEVREREFLMKSIDALTKATGKRPVGYRAPSWHFSQFTMKQIREAGFLYDSSLLGSDDPYEILLDGEGSNVIELPIERIVEDAPYFGASSGSLPSPDLVANIFRSEFDAAWAEGGLVVLTMHPHLMGHRSRIAALDKLVAYMKSKPRVWFATEEQVANYLKGSAMKQ